MREGRSKRQALTFARLPADTGRTGDLGRPAASEQLSRWPRSKPGEWMVVVVVVVVVAGQELWTAVIDADTA